MLSTSSLPSGLRYPLLALIAAALGTAAYSAPRKAARPAPAGRSAPAETVYVQVAPPRQATAASAAPKAPEPEAQPVSRRTERVLTGPSRDFSQAYGVYAGFYAAEVLGSNPFATVYWDLYPNGQAYFFEFTAGGGTVQSGFSRSVVGADEFEHNWLVALEALGGYSYSGLARGDGRGGGLYPYFVAGIAAVYQGGVPNVGGVIGFGNRMSMPFGPRTSRWALNYGVRDHIYSQKLRNEPSLTQNFVLLVGAQKYF